MQLKKNIIKENGTVNGGILKSYKISQQSNHNRQEKKAGKPTAERGAGGGFYYRKIVDLTGRISIATSRYPFRKEGKKRAQNTILLRKGAKHAPTARVKIMGNPTIQEKLNSLFNSER